MNLFQYRQRYYAYYSRYYGSQDHTRDVQILIFGEHVTEEEYLISCSRWFIYKLFTGQYR